MATQVILPALGIAQETGIIVRWLKEEGEEVAKGEPLAEIETDKAIVEIEAPATGILANVAGRVGVEIPVGQVIASRPLENYRSRILQLMGDLPRGISLRIDT